MRLLEFSRATYRIAAVAVLALTLGAAPALAGDATVAPLSPQPAASDVAPGLMASYYFALYRYVSEVESAAKKDSGKAGGPIARLDLKTTGPIFDSNATEGVGAIFTGLIKFPAAGDWKMVVLSNDGVRVTIADKEILVDPDVHADRFSNSSTVTVPSAGWYKLVVAYFQRHGTAALQLSWKAPGTEDYVLIPADAYGHLAAAK